MPKLITTNLTPFERISTAKSIISSVFTCIVCDWLTMSQLRQSLASYEICGGPSGNGAGLLLNFFGLLLLSNITPLLHFYEMCIGPDHTAHYHILGLQVAGFISYPELGKKVLFMIFCSFKMFRDRTKFNIQAGKASTHACTLPMLRSDQVLVRLVSTPDPRRKMERGRF